MKCSTSSSESSSDRTIVTNDKMSREHARLFSVVPPFVYPRHASRGRLGNRFYCPQP